MSRVFVFGLLVFIVLFYQADCRSVDTSIEVNGFRKKYYLENFFKASFYEAFQYCTLRGMRLATINSQQEHYDILKHLKEHGVSSGRYWTSGTDLGKEGSWLWYGTAEPFKYFHWKLREPSGGSYENCLEIWNIPGNWQWNDSNCNDRRNFICEDKNL